MSKGSSPRPYGVSLDTYGSNFDRIFGKQPPFSGDDCFHPSSITIVDEPEEIEEPEDDDEDAICSGCNGSGEGMYDGSSCYKCHGSGSEPVERDEDY